MSEKLKQKWSALVQKRLSKREIEIDCLFSMFPAEYVMEWALEKYEDEFIEEHKETFAEYEIFAQ